MHLENSWSTAGIQAIVLLLGQTKFMPFYRWFEFYRNAVKRALELKIIVLGLLKVPITPFLHFREIWNHLRYLQASTISVHHCFTTLYCQRLSLLSRT